MSFPPEVKTFFQARFVIRHFKAVLWCVLPAALCVGAQTTIVSSHKSKSSYLRRVGIRTLTVPKIVVALTQANVNQIACTNAQSTLNQLETTIAKLELQRAQCRPVRLEPGQNNPCIAAESEAINEWHKANDAQVKELTAEVARCQAGQPPVTPTPTPAPTPVAVPTAPDQATCVNAQDTLVQLDRQVAQLEDQKARCKPVRFEPGQTDANPCATQIQDQINLWFRINGPQENELKALLAQCTNLPPFPTPPPVPTPKPAPYDLVWDQVDANGFPLNPRWAKQDEYLKNVSNDLWNPIARPRIYDDCLNAAEKQNVIGVGNDYNPFRNGYCKHSPGIMDSQLPFAYCQGDTEQQPYQPGGPVYCASWSWKDEPPAGKCALSSFIPSEVNPFNIPYHLSGHLNFQVVAYDGVLRWDNAQIEKTFGDYDWCMDLYTPHGVGASSLHDDEVFIHGEVNPQQVGDGFGHGFWQVLRDNIHKGQVDCGITSPYCQQTTDNQNRTVAPMINGKRAIFIGLLALDMGHDQAQAEIHPLYGVAIHIGGRTLTGSGCDWSTGHCTWDNNVYLHPEADPLFDVPVNADDDQWDMWAANYGSSGYCSTGALHVLDGPETIIGRNLTTMSFSLPWAKDEAGRPMAGVEIVHQTTSFFIQGDQDFDHQVTYDPVINPGQNIIVTFQMPPSEHHPYWYGELHLKWTRQPGMAAAKLKLPGVVTAPPHPSSHMSPEEQENSAMAGMTEGQKQIFIAELKKAGPLVPAKPKVSIQGTLGKVPLSPPPANLPKVLPKTPKPMVSAEDIAIWRALCAAWSGKVPNQSANFCRQPPH